jgi:predicted nucleotidyltransferase
MVLADYLENKLGRKVDILTPDGLKTIRVKQVAEKIKKSVVYV